MPYLALGEEFRPIISARLVMMHEVAPKIYFVAFGLLLWSEPNNIFLFYYITQSSDFLFYSLGRESSSLL